MSSTGNELKEHNENIIKCLIELKNQRKELSYLIEKQEEEKNRLQTEIERISYKLSLIHKSLCQRIKTRLNYDRTIKQVETKYNKLVESSGILLREAKEEVGELEQSIDKSVGTESFVITNMSSEEPTNSNIKQEFEEI